MIYDCFMFFNELDLLEIRLNELHSVVDRFVLVEATTTHSGNPKQLFFKNNQLRYAKFLDKIDHIIVNDLPEVVSSAWDRENYHRNCIFRGLSALEDDDIVMISDMDEIPRLSVVCQINEMDVMKNYSAITLSQECYYYYLNCHNPKPWCGTVVVPKYKGKVTFPQHYRDTKDQYPRLENGGWHFGYLGGAEAIKYKLESFAHTEYDNNRYNNQDYIDARLRDGKDFYQLDNQLEFRPIDDKYPQYVRDNQRQFAHLIKQL